MRGLRKSYGSLEAVRGIDLEVQGGEVFAFLGPNGAGKTTTVEILEGYRQRSTGEVVVLGTDPQSAGRAWRGRIGMVPQDCNVPPYLTVREALAMFAGYYRRPRPVEEVISVVGLEGKADERTERLSGGQQRRLDVGMALVGDPELLFLDEPTTGFDPSARRQAWGVIANLRQLGKTIFLTTHYMDEAQSLADRVAIIAGGEIVAEGRPDELGEREKRPSVIRFRLPQGMAPARLPAGLGEVAGAANGALSIEAQDPVPVLNSLTGWALAEGIRLDGLEVSRPSLEDIYLELTGR